MQRRPLVFSELNPLYGLEAQRARGAVKCQEATLSSVGNEIVTHIYFKKQNTYDEGNQIEKSSCGFALQYFQTETPVHISTKIRALRRGAPTRKPMDRWVRC